MCRGAPTITRQKEPTLLTANLGHVAYIDTASYIYVFLSYVKIFNVITLYYIGMCTK